MVAAVTSGAGFSQQFVDLFFLRWVENTNPKSSHIKLLSFMLIFHFSGSSARVGFLVLGGVF